MDILANGAGRNLGRARLRGQVEETSGERQPRAGVLSWKFVEYVTRPMWGSLFRLRTRFPAGPWSLYILGMRFRVAQAFVPGLQCSFATVCRKRSLTRPLGIR